MLNLIVQIAQLSITGLLGSSPSAGREGGEKSRAVFQSVLEPTAFPSPPPQHTLQLPYLCNQDCGGSGDATVPGPGPGETSQAVPLSDPPRTCTAEPQPVLGLRTFSSSTLLPMSLKRLLTDESRRDRMMVSPRPKSPSSRLLKN